MFGILLTAGSIGVVVTGGLAVSIGLKWFHEFDYNFEKKEKREDNSPRKSNSTGNSPKKSPTMSGNQVKFNNLTNNVNGKES